MDAPLPPPLASVPFEFVVFGRPISHQSRNKLQLSEWKAAVRRAAATRWGERQPLECGLRIAVAFYHDDPIPRFDGDNVLKPIQDALIGLLYRDDVQITDAAVRKTAIATPVVAWRASPELLGGFADGREFVHVILDIAPGHENPLR